MGHDGARGRGGGGGGVKIRGRGHAVWVSVLTPTCWYFSLLICRKWEINRAMASTQGHGHAL